MQHRYVFVSRVAAGFVLASTIALSAAAQLQAARIDVDRDVRVGANQFGVFVGEGAQDAGGWRPFVGVPGELEFSGELTVRPRQDLGAARTGQARARLNGLIEDYYPETDEYTIRVPAGYGGLGEGENRLARELLATGEYQYVHPNWICYPIATPNDPLFGSQWHHTMMQSQAAWDLLTGSPSVIVAVTDTGILTTHADLTNRVPGFNAVDDLAEVDGGQMEDVNGHGTHVAGCAAAVGNNGVGVAGVGWNLSVMSIRVSNAAGGGAFLDDITQGARWAVENGARSASSSYTGVEWPGVETSGEYIRSIGGVYLYAANNSNQNHSGFDHPNVTIVGASDQADVKAGFSSYGRAVDLFAPGVSILSTIRDGGYGYASGTSMATPVANGVVGMIFSANPLLSPEHAEFILLRSCDDWATPGDDELTGWGRTNLLRAVQAALASNGPAAPIVQNESATTGTGMTVLFDVLANDFDPNMDAIELASFSAASSRGGSVTLLPGAGPDGRPMLSYTAPATTGPDVITYSVSDGTLSTGGMVGVDVLDQSAFRDPENPSITAEGVRVKYYALPALSVLPDYSTRAPYAQDVVPSINFNSTDGVFITSGRADDVGAVFTGYVTVPSTGVYTFSTTSDDGSKLYVGSTEVVNNDGLHGMETRSGEIALKQGTHAVRVDFFERGGGAGVIASLSGPGLAAAPIDASMWSRACDADVNMDGMVDVLDLLDVLNAIGACQGAALPCGSFGVDADFNVDQTVDILDLLDFLNAFSAGC
jgi:subtilisin family serine protease